MALRLRSMADLAPHPDRDTERFLASLPIESIIGEYRSKPTPTLGIACGSGLAKKRTLLFGEASEQANQSASFISSPSLPPLAKQLTQMMADHIRLKFLEPALEAGTPDNFLAFWAENGIEYDRASEAFRIVLAQTITETQGEIFARATESALLADLRTRAEALLPDPGASREIDFTWRTFAAARKYAARMDRLKPRKALAADDQKRDIELARAFNARWLAYSFALDCLAMLCGGFRADAGITRTIFKMLRWGALDAYAMAREGTALRRERPEAALQEMYPPDAQEAALAAAGWDTDHPELLQARAG